MEEIEVWLPVVGLEGRYEVSNHGRLKTLSYKGMGMVKIMKTANDGKGYQIVTLYKGNRGRTSKVHRCVAEAFHANPNNLPTVNHINGNKSDNRAKNLEWASVQQNVSHAYRTGLKTMSKGQDAPWSKLKECEVVAIRERVANGEKQRDIANCYGVCFQTVNVIVKNRSWSHLAK